MMNRRESLIGGRNIPVLSQHRRGQSLTLAGHKEVSADENNLDLFSKNRRSLSVTSSDESSDVSVKLGRLSVGSAKVSRNGIDDLLSSADGGKHDYDWLLTPPGTPTIFPSSEGSESQPTIAASRSSSLARSSSTTKASRLSVSQSENNYHSSRATRSSSVTRSSTYTSLYNTCSSNRSGSILNTSSASVSSYTRPSSPITRSPSTARPSTPSGRATLSRPSTPSRGRPSPTSSSTEKPRSVQSSRPSTPSSRPQIPANLSSPAARSNSRPSTPTHRNPVSSISPAASPTISMGRVVSNGRSPNPSSRPSSPGPRVRPPPQPVVPPDFPLDTPPNLRTTLPADRPVSAGRSRPVAAVSNKGNSETTAATNTSRRHSSPIVTRGRLSEPTGRGRLHGNGHLTDAEARKVSHIPDLGMRKPAKTSTTSADGTGFGRTISKKSLDMAIRHMDIRNGAGNIRPITGTTLFPQSIRSATQKTQSVRSLSSSSVSINGGGLQTSYNGIMLESGNNIDRSAENGFESDCARHSAKLSEVDIHESSRYDAILLKEDLKNTNWLHSIDDKTDSGPIFDNGFEALPEPFGLL
ncbi:serine/arginine repetitive matrix-like protein [Parasponia andersonii]|uniref:Serine/arginine repetitive matrix-like protein n=1 Tax=Parasponia andersonii TaxID=3476 RepID=A0A2P5A7T1_PARAD|nr:serine/arginine repetitive matrix-like protein [Parasponia andersonii]